MRDPGRDICSAIVAIHARVRRHRLELITHIPEVVHHHSCTERGHCSKDWIVGYSAVMMLFAHTQVFYTGRMIFEKMKRVVLPSLSDQCRRLTFDDLSEKGSLWGEESIINSGVKTIKSLLRDTRPSYRPDLNLASFPA